MLVATCARQAGQLALEGLEHGTEPRQTWSSLRWSTAQLIADPSPFLLESDFAPTPASPDALTLRLHNGTALPLAGFKLAMTGMFRIEPDAGMIGGTLAAQLSYHHVVAPSDGFIVAPGAIWEVTARRISTDATTKVPRHYTYGPRSAYLIFEDGTARPVEVLPMTRAGTAGAPARTPPPSAALPAGEGHPSPSSRSPGRCRRWARAMPGRRWR